MYQKILKDKQELILLRKKLLTYCSPKILSRITPNNLMELAPYISPYPMDKLQELIATEPTLLYYLTLKDIDYLSLEKEREGLLEELIGIAKGDFNPEDAGIAKIKLQAIQLALGKLETKPSSGSDLSARELQTLLPSSLKNASVEDMKREIEKLNPHPRQ
jgi:hypothetical protein